MTAGAGAGAGTGAGGAQLTGITIVTSSRVSLVFYLI